MPPIIVVVCVISTGLLYYKVYAAVRHHTIQINALQVQVAQNGDMANAVRVKKAIFGIFYVYVVFLVC